MQQAGTCSGKGSAMRFRCLLRNDDGFINRHEIIEKGAQPFLHSRVYEARLCGAKGHIT